jgi:4-diphosphocytidyl-2-C-methyl-D-erythritol kinase
MNSIIIKAYGKINLSLDVIGKRPDGYHDVAMIMQTVNICDTLTMSIRDDENICITTDLEGLTCGEDNLVYKAIEMLRKEFEITKGVTVFLEKRIPMAAGMAGGSADCAAALKGMNELFELGLDDKALMERGVKLGADVPYCVIGGTALCQGIGEVITPLSPLTKGHLVVATPDVNVSTPWVYKNLILNENTIHPDTELMLKAVKDENIELLAKNMYNVLETVTAKEYGVITKLENIMKDGGALGSIMSGSGPTVFGIFDDESKAKAVYSTIKENVECRSCYITQFAKM